MMLDSDFDYTVLLWKVREGDGRAESDLFERLQVVMRSTANFMMRNESKAHTLQPTAVVNEAVIRILKSGLLETAENRRLLFGAANKAMRDVLVDHARKRSAAKRPESGSRSSMDEMLNALKERDNVEILELNDALEILRTQMPRQAEIVELRFFSGLTNDEIADMLGIGSATVKRDWIAARARLQVLMGHVDAEK